MARLVSRLLIVAGTVSLMLFGTILTTSRLAASEGTKLSLQRLVPTASLGASNIANNTHPGSNIGSWELLTSGTSSALQAVYFTSATHGWASGWDSVLLHTSDSGVNWSPVATGVADPSYGYNSVRFLDSDIGWVGGFKSLARSDDAGSTWKGVTSSGTDLRYATFPISSTTAWQVGPVALCFPCASKLYRLTLSADGTSLTTQFYYLATNNHYLVGLDFIDQDNGWAVGKSIAGTSDPVTSVVVRISDASQNTPNLMMIASEILGELNAIDMVDNSRGWAVGANGSILKTEDGGATWNLQASGTTASLYAVNFLDLDHGWVVGASGTVLMTDDGGTTWIQEDSGTTSSLRSVFFVDQTIGYAVGSNGTIIRRQLSTYMVGGTVSDLVGSGLVLHNNGGDDLAITANGLFTFSTALADGSAYSVTVKTQPTNPTQTCTVSNGSGNVAGSNATNVAVTCATSTYMVGGTVSDLVGSGLVLHNNGGDDLAITANGLFTFSTALADGSSYSVTVKTQPTNPTQTCTVSNGSGSIAGSNANVAVTCAMRENKSIYLPIVSR